MDLENTITSERIHFMMVTGLGIRNLAMGHSSHPKGSMWANGEMTRNLEKAF